MDHSETERSAHKQPRTKSSTATMPNAHKTIATNANNKKLRSRGNQYQQIATLLVLWALIGLNRTFDHKRSALPATPLQHPNPRFKTKLASTSSTPQPYPKSQLKHSSHTAQLPPCKIKWSRQDKSWSCRTTTAQTSPCKSRWSRRHKIRSHRNTENATQGSPQDSPSRIQVQPHQQRRRSTTPTRMPHKHPQQVCTTHTQQAHSNKHPPPHNKVLHTPKH